MKKDIRKHIKSLVAALTAEQKAECAMQLLEVISEEPHFISASRVLIYNPLPDEINVLPILERFKGEKRFFMPKVEGDDIKILPYSEKQRIGAYNIAEPVGDDYVALDTIDLVIVPGVGFSAEGHRLGRGKGFYDRLLSGAACYKIGVCYPCQICTEIAQVAEPHDVMMDKVLSPS